MFDEMMMMTATIPTYSWNNSPRVDILPHSDTLSWFWTNQSYMLHAQQIIYQFQSLVSPNRGSNSRSSALVTSIQTIKPLMWLHILET